MQIFDELLNKARKDFADGNCVQAQESIRAASKYLKALIDAQKQVAEPKLPGT